MHFWGYATHPDASKGSETQFATYTDQTPEELATYNSFRSRNDMKIAKPEVWEVNGDKSFINAFKVIQSVNKYISKVEVKNP
jgi:hypothetical protein